MYSTVIQIYISLFSYIYGTYIFFIYIFLWKEICIYTLSTSFSLVGYYEMLSIVPCVIQKVLVSYFSYIGSCSVTKSCPTPCNPMDCSLPGFSVHGVFQSRTQQWIAISFSRGSSWLRDWTCISCISRRILYHWAIREVYV